VPEVGLDEHRPVVERRRERAREPAGDRGLPLARHGARDEDRPHVADLRVVADLVPQAAQLVVEDHLERRRRLAAQALEQPPEEARLGRLRAHGSLTQ
jgi:hypothetical protein